VNPTGLKDHFRGVDWVIEHNNLYIKQIFGGSGSNHNTNRMIEASPLIEVYKDVRAQFEQMFSLTHKTSRHSPPKMRVTFDKLRKHMELNKANEFIPGRPMEHNVVRTREIGMEKLQKAVHNERKDWTERHEKQEQLRRGAESHKENTGIKTEHTETEAENDGEENPEEPDEEEEAVHRLKADKLGLFVDKDSA
jgi:hypothetical protein